MFRRGWKLVLPVLAVCVLGATAAACSSGSSSSSSAADTSNLNSPAYVDCSKTPPGTPETLTVAAAAVVADFSPLYVAKAHDFFNKCGVNVNILDNTLGNTLSDLTSGQADLGYYSGTVALSAAQQGEPTKIIYLAEIQPGFAFVTTSSISSVSQLQSTSNCRIAVAQQATSGYGEAQMFIKELKLNNCTPVVITSPTLQVASVASGQVNAAVLLQNYAEQAVAQGAHELINPTLPSDRSKYFKTVIPTAMMFGVDSNLKAKKEGVVQFIRALNLSIKAIGNETDTQVANDLYSADPLFRSTPVDKLAQQFGTSVRPYIAKSLVTPLLGNRIGYISKSAWTTALGLYGDFGLSGYSATNPVFQYSQRVDMSYYDAALPA